MRAWSPLFWTFIELRDLITADILHYSAAGRRKRGLAAASLRWMVDRLWRR